jgi:hypothetical protein
MLLLALACATSTLRENYDPFTGSTILEYSTPLALHYEGQSGLVDFLNTGPVTAYSINLRGSRATPLAEPGKGPSPSTLLVIEYEGGDWFFIDEHGTLSLLFTDGSSVDLDAANVVTDTYVISSNVYCWEKALITIAPQYIDSLCQGRVTMMRLHGRDVYQDLTVPDNSRRRLNDLWLAIQGLPPDTTARYY